MERRTIAYPLSIEEMNTLMGGRAMIITYPELDEYESIDEVLGPNGMAILLYLVDDNVGHYACIFRRSKNRLEFFDSYGIYLDDELEFVSDIENDRLGQEMPFLKRLIKRSKYNEIVWNDVALQERVAGVNTCGRHCAFRMFKKSLTHDNFIKIFRQAMEKGVDPDQLVTTLTNGLF